MSPSWTAPYPYRSRALLDGTLLAESEHTIRVDLPDAAPELWFPRADVVNGAVDGDDGPWRAGADDLVDFVAFDPGQVQLEIVDGLAGDDERDVTTKRFPNWGDAADLIDLLDVRSAGDGCCQCAARQDWMRPVVEGSQVLGQAIVAASHRSPNRRVVSASMVFPRSASARSSYTMQLDPITDGRTFTALRAQATQGDRTCAFGTLLLDVTAPDVIRHHDPAPEVPGPYDSAPFDMGVTGRDLRIVGGAYTGDPDAPVGPPELSAWVRFRQVPDDGAIHAGLLAQFTGHMPIAAALRPHAGIGQDQAHRTLSTAISAISLAIHAEVRADRWMLYHHRSTFAGDGMTHAECRVYDEHGGLLASFTVEAMVRDFADRSTAADYRSAM
jgi:acyl-CoA thioesterase II